MKLLKRIGTLLGCGRTDTTDWKRGNPDEIATCYLFSEYEQNILGRFEQWLDTNMASDKCDEIPITSFLVVELLMQYLTKLHSAVEAPDNVDEDSDNEIPVRIRCSSYVYPILELFGKTDLDVSDVRKLEDDVCIDILDTKHSKIMFQFRIRNRFIPFGLVSYALGVVRNLRLIDNGTTPDKYGVSRLSAGNVEKDRKAYRSFVDNMSRISVIPKTAMRFVDGDFLPRCTTIRDSVGFDSLDFREHSDSSRKHHLWKDEVLSDNKSGFVNAMKYWVDFWDDPIRDRPNSGDSLRREYYPTIYQRVKTSSCAGLDKLNHRKEGSKAFIASLPLWEDRELSVTEISACLNKTYDMCYTEYLRIIREFLNPLDERKIFLEHQAEDLQYLRILNRILQKTSKFLSFDHTVYAGNEFAWFTEFKNLMNKL